MLWRQQENRVASSSASNPTGGSRRADGMPRRLTSWTEQSTRRILRRLASDPAPHPFKSCRSALGHLPPRSACPSVSDGRISAVPLPGAAPREADAYRLTDILRNHNRFSNVKQQINGCYLRELDNSMELRGTCRATTVIPRTIDSAGSAVSTGHEVDFRTASFSCLP